MTPSGRLAGLRQDFDRSFTEPARRHDVEHAELLAVRAGGRPYALRLSQTAGLYPDRPVTPLPGPLSALLGVAGFGGTIVPVYDLAALLGHPLPERPRWLVLASGAGANAQKSIGIAVLTGMLGSTILTVTFVPSVFVVMQRLEEWRERRKAARKSAAPAAPSPAA